MRIGVITVEAGTNYGAVLQCYAFQKILKDMDNDVEFLRVKPAPVSSLTLLRARLAVATWRDLKQLFHRDTIVELPDEKKEMNIVFDAFREHFFQMSPILDKESVGDYANAHYDAIIVGSDQVWTWLYNPNNASFVGWSPEFKGRRMTYASCSAYSCLRDWRRKHQIAGFLSKFDYISVRDITTQKLIRNITGKEVDIVPDPSELYDYEEFRAFSPNIDAPYIFVYVLGSEINGGHKLAIEKIKRQYGELSVIGVKTANQLTGVHAIADAMLDNFTPQQWVSYLSHAKVVYTDSFHAILFSIKFGVPFVGYYKNTIRASRLLYLHQKYPEAMIVSDSGEINMITTIKGSKIGTSPINKMMRVVKE